MYDRIHRLEPGEGAIKNMDVKDLDQVLSMEASSSLCPWSKEMFAEELRNPLAFCFVMWDGRSVEHQILGFICFRNVSEESELLNITVHPQYRRRGIGKSLMEFYINFCKNRQVKQFHLEVNTANATAIHLYKLFSYQPTGVRKKFYQGKFDALLMVRETENR
jgi:ribosomal-protein-alanine N-acetyltransferase